ncbi:hypothetical protein Acr_00g0031270 [Actinidia rufa]|uniref:Uncharacterized protein n=1 Tax=Actinidia rufa TaxID=165716 RepID=A0A7J0DFK9_9ERIC|nr:hypothetical protein Acr_00g0031270 [Actinidia rufa]
MMTLDKNCGKFRGKTLEHSDLMKQVFGGRTPNEEAQRGQKRADRPSSGNKSASGKKKMSAATRLSRTIDKMLEVVQSQGSEVTVKPHADSNNATIGNCLHLLANLPGMDLLSPLYLLGTQLITIPANHKVFMELPNDDVRLAWLQLHRDQATGTASPPFPGPYTRPPHLPIIILDNLDVL